MAFLTTTDDMLAALASNAITVEQLAFSHGINVDGLTRLLDGHPAPGDVLKRRTSTPIPIEIDN